MKLRYFIGVVGFLYIAGQIGTFENTYTREVICTSSNAETTTFIDVDGNYWEWFNEGQAFEVGTDYVLTMDMNHTADIYDDKIVKIS